jgi:hypothetical protein
VDAASLVTGRHYAFREKRSSAQPFFKVKLLEVVGRGGKVKIEYEDGPHPGLTEYVHTRQLVVAWGDRQAYLRDEQRHEQLKKTAAEFNDRAISTAVEAILESTGENEAWLSPDGITSSRPALERLLERSGIDTDPLRLHPHAYVDRFGQTHLPPQAAEVIARAFAAAEPAIVLMHLEDQEEELRSRGYDPGERMYHRFLREYQPGYALARQWAGIQREAEELRKEIGRLRSLIAIAARDLKEAGAEHRAVETDGVEPWNISATGSESPPRTVRWWQWKPWIFDR